MTNDHPATYGNAARVDHDTARHAFTLYTQDRYSLAQVAARVPAIAEAVPAGMWEHRGTYAQEVIQDYVAYLFGIIQDLPQGDCATPPAPPRPTLRQRLIQGAVEEYNRRMRRHQ